MKKNWYFVVPLLLVAAPVLLSAWYVTSYGYSWSEAWSCVKHYGQSSTRYGQKFTESQLSRITPGMKGDQVFQLIGQPMEGHIKDGKPAPLWRYSLPNGSSTYYHERAVLFDLPPGKPPTVKAIVRRFHQPGETLPGT